MCNTQLTRWCNDPGHELGYWGYLRLRYTQVDLVIIGLFHRGMTSSPNLIHHCSQRKWQLMTISTTSGNNYSSSTGNKVHSIKLEFCLANYAVDGFDDRNALQQAKKVSESSSQNSMSSRSWHLASTNSEHARLGPRWLMRSDAAMRMRRCDLWTRTRAFEFGMTTVYRQIWWWISIFPGKIADCSF